MPSLMAIIGGNANPLAKEFNRVERMASKVGGSIAHEIGGKLAGLASAAALEQMAHKTIEFGEHVSVLAQRLGISTDAVQAWGYALKMSGSSIDEAVPFFEKLAVGRKKALEGNDKAVESFKRLGVSLDDLKSKRLEDIGLQISKAFQAGDPQKLIADLREVGGKGAGAMVAAFRDGLGEMVDEAKNAGLIIDSETIGKLRESAEKMKTLGVEIQAAFAPALVMLSDLATSLWRNLQRAGMVLVTLPRFGLKAFREESKEMEAKWKEEDRAAKERREKRAGPGGTGGVDDETDKKAGHAAERSAEKILRLKEELFRLQEANDLKQLTKEEQISELMRRRAHIIELMNEIKPNNQDGMLKAAIDVEKIDADLARLNSETGSKEKGEGAQVNRGVLTANQRVGAYSAPATVTMIDLTRKSERHLDKIQKYLGGREKLMPKHGGSKF